VRWIFWLVAFSILSMLYMTDGLIASDSLPSREHLFIEFWEHQDGKLINGKAYKMMIDFPTYSLENGSLTSIGPIDVGPAAMAIFGTGSSLSGDMGGGAASGLVTVTELPYFIGSYFSLNISITQIVGEIVTLDLSGRQMRLEPGESWKKERTDTEEIQDSLMKVTTTLTVSNHGKVAFQPPKDALDGKEMI